MMRRHRSLPPEAERTMPSPQAENSEISAASERFFSSAVPRMLRAVLVLGMVCTLIAAWRFGRAVGLGYAAGAITAYLSFRSLHEAVRKLAHRIVDTHRPERGFSLFHGFFLRYLLAGAIAYVIFSSSSQAFRGFLFGLCTPVGAMLLEAGYEAYVALRRGY
jgi:ATP synthase I chain